MCSPTRPVPSRTTRRSATRDAHVLWGGVSASPSAVAPKRPPASATTVRPDPRDARTSYRTRVTSCSWAPCLATPELLGSLVTPATPPGPRGGQLAHVGAVP